jgi:hypothetical protein
MYIVDFDESTLFSENKADPTRPTARQLLHLGNKQSTTKYLEILLMLLVLEHHNVFTRVAKLPDQALALLAATFEQKYNSVDSDITVQRLLE